MLMTVVAVVLCLAGVPAGAQQGNSQGNNLRFANSGDFLSMDQHFSGDAFAVGILLDVNEPLVVRNTEGRLEPALATEWERASPTVWRFKLRTNVHFHEGQPLTADDVVFTLERARHENSTYRPYLSHITAVRAIDALTGERKWEVKYDGAGWAGVWWWTPLATSILPAVFKDRSSGAARRSLLPAVMMRLWPNSALPANPCGRNASVEAEPTTDTDSMWIPLGTCTSAVISTAPPRWGPAIC